MPVERVIDHRIYPRKAVAEAHQAYRNYLTLAVTPLGSDQARIIISVKPEHEANDREVALEFLNYLLDKAAEIQIERE
jgi:hypothetical protein